MNENKIDNIKTHLEFLGYVVTSEINDKENKFLLAKSSLKPNLVLWFGHKDEERTWVRFQSGWNGVKIVDAIAQFKKINEINRNLAVAKLTVDYNDGSLDFYSTYMGEYNKKVFGDFIDLFINGVQQTMGSDEFQKLFNAKS